MSPRAFRILLYFLLLAVTVVILRLEGRAWWCACGEFRIWDGDIWSSPCSQHPLDPYSFPHVLPGGGLFLVGLGLVANMDCT